MFIGRLIKSIQLQKSFNMDFTHHWDVLFILVIMHSVEITKPISRITKGTSGQNRYTSITFIYQTASFRKLYCTTQLK